MDLWLHVVTLLYYHITGCHGLVYPLLFLEVAGCDISLPLHSDWEVGMELLLVYHSLVVYGLFKVNHSIQHLILYSDKLHGLYRCLLIHSSYNSHLISHIPYILIQYSPVICRGLRIGLPCQSKPCLRYIMMGQDTLYPRYLRCYACIYVNDLRTCVGRS